MFTPRIQNEPRAGLNRDPQVVSIQQVTDPPRFAQARAPLRRIQMLMIERQGDASKPGFSDQRKRILKPVMR